MHKKGHGRGTSFSTWSTAGLLACLVMAAATPLAAEPALEWGVANPFRVFLVPADPAQDPATELSLTEEEREKRPVRAAERKLDERHRDGWSATMVAKTCWDAEHNRYACGDHGDYLAPKSHAIVAEMVGLDDAQTVDCQWLT